MSISKTKKAKLKLSLPNNCWYCGKEDPSTIEHVTPKSKGGSDNLDNLVLACKKCNSSKKDKSVEEFRFHTAWLSTEYSKAVNSTGAKQLLSMGVIFTNFNPNHKFWFEGL